MPVYRRSLTDPGMQSAPVEEKSLWDRIGGIRGLGAAGIRGISGILSAPGGVWGAGASGVGEGIAQVIEGNDPFTGKGAAKIGIEAGLGAIPAGRLIQGGRFLGSALRSGGLAATGEALREVADEGVINPLPVAVHGLTGGLIGGTVGRLSRSGTPGAPKVDIEQGGRPISPTPYSPPSGSVYGRTTPPARARVSQLSPNNLDEQDFQSWVTKQPGFQPELPFNAPTESFDELADMMRPSAYRQPYGVSIEDRFTARPEVLAAEAKAAKEAQKIAEAEEAAAQIAKAKEGLTAQESVSETISSPIPGGSERLTTRFVLPDDESAEAGAGAATRRIRSGQQGRVREEIPEELLPQEGTPARLIYDAWRGLGRDNDQAIAFAEKGISPRPLEGVPNARVINATPIAAPVAPVAQAAEEVAPEIPGGVTRRAPQDLEDDSDLVALRETLGVAGPGSRPNPVDDMDDYQSLRAALGFGVGRQSPAEALDDPLEFTGLERNMGIGNDPEFPLNFFRSRAGAAGQNIGNIKRAQAAGEVVPEEGVQAARNSRIRESQAMRETPLEPAPQATPDWVNEEMGFLDKMKNLGGKLGGDESGAVPLESALTMGSAAAGAGLGFAADPFDNPTLSAIAGGIGGAIAPSAVRMLSESGVPSNVIGSVDTSTPEGLKAGAIKVLNSLPQWQRFNYLADVEGLAANAGVGPYGAILTGAVEAILKGDQRGYALLRSLNPVEFIQDAKKGWGEASTLIERGEVGRAENMMLGPNASITEQIRSAPGIIMTAGDVAARSRAQAAGFTEAEARAMTLTSEPENPTLRQLAHAGTVNQNENEFDLFKTLLNLQFPFRRTPVNIGEQGARRIPLVGFAAEQMRETPENLRGQLVQQGMGAGIGAANYGLGASLSPEEAKHARRFSTNLSGRYSLPAAVGFAAGQATQRGSDPVYTGAVEGVGDVLPIPQNLVINQWLKFLTGEGPLPRGAMPRLLQEQLSEGAGTQTGIQPLRVSGVRRIRY